MSLSGRPPWSHLLPLDDILTGFTTSLFLHHPKITVVDLADDQLGVHKISSKTSHITVCPPIPKKNLDAQSPGSSSSLQVDSQFPPPTTAWEARYPKGSINPSGAIPGGFGFYLVGPPAFAKELESASEALFSYRMMLQEEWEWVKGGKLPGVYGGVGELAYGCTGGRKEERCQCFNLRPMWRPQCVAELYAYIPLTDKNAEQLKSVPPKSLENNDYGFSVGRGAFHLERAIGQWVSIAFRVKLNDIGKINGEIQVWFDGQSVIDVGGLSLRESEDGKIKGMHFQTFFGGHGPEWASPKDQRAWFADVTGAIIR